MCVFAKKNSSALPKPACKNEVPFVPANSIVRRIWQDRNAILLIFAAAAGEFAYNRSAHWLFFTGKLPNDPIGRLFSTVAYAQSIVLAGEDEAMAAIEKINKIHKAVETERGMEIPQWAYRSVLYMLVDYTTKAGKMLYHNLTIHQEEEICRVFMRMGLLMGIKQLPATLPAWKKQRQQHLMAYTAATHHTTALYTSYRTHLGWLRYHMLCHIQAAMCPQAVLVHSGIRKHWWAISLLSSYLHIRRSIVGRSTVRWLMPPQYQASFAAMGTI